MAKKKKTTKKATKKTTKKRTAKKTTKKKTTRKATKKTTAKKTKKAATRKAAKKTTAKVAGEARAASQVNVGDLLPAFSLPATSGQRLSADGFRGKKLVLYFYPKDNTPGCTLEGQDFKKLYSDFQAASTEILGVSRDTVKSHENFKSQCGFPFALLSDENDFLSKPLGVIQMKNMYGKVFEGIERSTFVFDENGRLLKEWRKVKVDGHAQEVLTYIRSL